MIQKTGFSIVFIWLLLLGEWTQAQTYTLPDPNFRNYLANNIPSVLNSSQQLIIANAMNYTGTISCQGQNIWDLSGLQYFHKITMLNASYNQITFLPPLDSLLQLSQLWVYNNRISVLPRVNQLVNLQVLNVKNNQLQALPSLDGMIALKQLDCSLNFLTELPELNSLVNLEEFFCYNNLLTAIPAITNLKALKTFNVQRNNLTVLPDLSQNAQINILQFDYNQIDLIPSVAHMTGLSQLIFSGNKVAALPDLSANKGLTLIFADSNRLTRLPDLSSFTSLTDVRLRYNLLTFGQIIPSAGNPQFTAAFHIQPQDTIRINKTITVVKGSPLAIDLGIDAQVTGSTYTWYRNNQQTAITTVPQLLVDSVNESVAGTYTVSVTNSDPRLSGIALNVLAAHVSVAPCINPSGINYRILSNDCTQGATIQIDTSEIQGTNMGFTFKLVPLNNQKPVSASSTTMENVMSGSYSLLISNNNNCSVSLQNYIYIPSPTGCTESFTPNGDGVEDTYFISKTGTARIYDKNGVLIRTLQAPAYWDGKDETGKSATMGYYLILINDKEKTGVTLID